MKHRLNLQLVGFFFAAFASDVYVTYACDVRTEVDTYLLIKEDHKCHTLTLALPE